MKRRLAVLVAATLACLLVGGAAFANPIPSPHPLGLPFLESLGWWESDMNGASAHVVSGGSAAVCGAGSNSSALRMEAGPGNSVTEGGQVFLSTTLGFVPGVTDLSTMQELSYCTHTGNDPTSSVTMQIAIDLDGIGINPELALPNWDTTLVFEPSFQPGFASGTWQRWQTLDGLWYSTQPIEGFANVGVPFTLDELFAEHGGATISLIPSDFGGSIRLQFGSTGGDYANDHAFADNVIILLEPGLIQIPGFRLDFNLLPGLVGTPTP